MIEPTGFYWSDLEGLKFTEYVPFMVDCPNNGTQAHWVDVDCCNSEDGDDGQVRNPAIEWVSVLDWSSMTWPSDKSLFIRWVAVGVKGEAS